MLELLTNETLWLVVEGALLGFAIASGVGAVGVVTWGAVRVGGRAAARRGLTYLARRHWGPRLVGAAVGAYLNLQTGGSPPPPPPVVEVALKPCAVRCSERQETGSAIRCVLDQPGAESLPFDDPATLERAFHACATDIVYVDNNAGRAVRDRVRAAAVAAGANLRDAPAAGGPEVTP